MNRFVDNTAVDCDRLVRNAVIARAVALVGAIAGVLASSRSFRIVDERATCFRFVGCCC
jgi:hypothetical protein